MSVSPAPDGTGRPRKRAREGDEAEAAESITSNGTSITRRAGPTSMGRGYGSNNGAAGIASGNAHGAAASAREQYGQAKPEASAVPAGEAVAPATAITANVAGEPQTHVPNAQRVNRGVPITKETLESSFFILEPHDEFTREVGDWIWTWCNNRANVEIEAKIGLLVDNRPGLPPRTRVSFPLATETILTDTSFARFESNMTLRQHHHFNQILNMRAQEANQPAYTGAPIRYVHTKEVDSFYPAALGPGQSGGQNRTKIRVTRDERTGQVKPGGKASIEKSRIADMNIFSPKRGFDVRISISVEQPMPIPNTKVSHQRWKNRVSYQHQAVTIDLTQVKNGDAQREVMHELEIEFSDMPLLMHEGQKNARGEESLYYDLIQVFLNNIRMLIRNGVPP